MEKKLTVQQDELLKSLHDLSNAFTMVGEARKNIDPETEHILQKRYPFAKEFTEVSTDIHLWHHYTVVEAIRRVQDVNGFHEAKFGIEGFEDVTFMGYTKGETWNGWACPRFSKKEADRVLDSMGDGEYCELDDTFTFKIDGSTNPEEWHVHKGEDILVYGETVHVYAIGSGSWIWDEVEEVDDDEDI